MRRRSFLLGAPAAAAAKLAAQSSIAVDVRLVQVTFSVRDRQGKIAPNLSEQDFQIFENGEPQRITRFTHGDDQPLRLGVLVDGSGSQDEFIERHRRDLADFLESALEPQDGAFLLGFGNTLRLVCDFANDGAAMMARLEYYRDRPGRLPKVGPDEDRDGGDNSSGYHMLDALETAQAADVRVFGIWYAGEEDGRLKVRDRYGLRVLTRLGEDSGGELFRASSESLREQFRRISEDLRTSYEAAYYSTHAESDGRFRQVAIRPKDPSLKVRARPGYYAR